MIQEEFENAFADAKAVNDKYDAPDGIEAKPDFYFDDKVAEILDVQTRLYDAFVKVMHHTLEWEKDVVAAAQYPEKIKPVVQGLHEKLAAEWSVDA